MANLTIYERASDPVFVAADVAGDTFVNNGNTELKIINDTPQAVDVTLTTQRPCNHGFTVDQVESAPGQTLFYLGPFGADRFNDAQGLVHVSYSDASALRVAVQKLR